MILREGSGEPGVPVLPEPAAQEVENRTDASAGDRLFVSEHPDRCLLLEIQIESDKVWRDHAVEIRKKTDPIARSHRSEERAGGVGPEDDVRMCSEQGVPAGQADYRHVRAVIDDAMRAQRLDARGYAEPIDVFAIREQRKSDAPHLGGHVPFLLRSEEPDGDIRLARQQIDWTAAGDQVDADMWLADGETPDAAPPLRPAIRLLA